MCVYLHSLLHCDLRKQEALLSQRGRAMLRVCIAFRLYTRMVWLPDGEKNSNICLLVLTWSTNVNKSPFSRTTAHIFCFPWRRPCEYHAICCINGKTIQCLPKPSQHVPIYLQQFPSYTMLISMRKSKNRHFYHISVYPGNAPGAITLSVVWMEREFDAYKLSCSICTHLSKTVSQLFEPQVQKIAVFTYRSPHFCFPWRRPCDYHAICCMDGKRIQCLQIVSLHVSI